MKKSEYNQIPEAGDKLWKHALSEKQFFGYEFLQIQKILNIRAEFLCKEIKFIIRIEQANLTNTDTTLSIHQKKTLRNAGYHTICLYTQEILSDFTTSLQYLTKEFTSIVGHQCG